MTAKGKTKKPEPRKPPIAFQWHRALREAPQTWDRPGKAVVVAVASVYADRAHSDGTNAKPSIRMLVAETGATERSVLLAVTLLVDLGWLVLTAKAVPYHSAAVYDLTFPMPAQEQAYDESSMPAQEQAYGGSPMPARMPVRMPAQEQVCSPSPTLEEDEESAGAPLPDGRVAALHRTDPFDLFGDDPEPGESVATNGVVAYIGQHIGRSFTPTPSLVLELGRAKGRTGWSDADLGAYCVGKLKECKENGVKVRTPAGFLATDLRSVNGHTVLSSRMYLAASWQTMIDLEAEILASGFRLGRGAPRVALRGMLDEDDQEMLDDVWSVKERDADRLAPLAWEVIDGARRHLDSLTGADPALVVQCQCGASVAPVELVDAARGFYRCPCPACGSDLVYQIPSTR